MDLAPDSIPPPFRHHQQHCTEPAALRQETAPTGRTGDIERRSHAVFALWITVPLTVAPLTVTLALAAGTLGPADQQCPNPVIPSLRGQTLITRPVWYD